jgi:hypothetical protein
VRTRTFIDASGQHSASADQASRRVHRRGAPDRAYASSISEISEDWEKLVEIGPAAERLALALTQGGMQRMVARTLAAFLFADRDSLTAADLVDRLGASTGSVSSAVRMLRTVGLVEPAAVPGSRREHHRMRDDAWATLMSSQNTLLALMRDVGDEGLATVPPGGPAARRLRRMRDFYAFVLAELPALLERWEQERARD